MDGGSGGHRSNGNVNVNGIHGGRSGGLGLSFGVSTGVSMGAGGLGGGFSSKKDRARHEAKHNPRILCEWVGEAGERCGRRFSRVDNMKDHVRRIHRKGQMEGPGLSGERMGKEKEGASRGRKESAAGVGAATSRLSVSE
jgi:hypothetical protein